MEREDGIREKAVPERRRLLAYYGDDFTGSTDVLEALFRMGIRSVLFLEPPSEERLNGRFAEAEAFGVAGVGRSMSPEEMERELRPIFQTMKRLGTAIVHYKICSTFDSSPHTGSIGKAAEIGRDVFGGGRYIPLLAGLPYLGRYTLFGHHFAKAGETVYRLDRHPTMSRHPVTPMDESDLRRHLAAQTPLASSLMDIAALDGPPEEVRGRLEELLAREAPAIVLFDVLDEPLLCMAGRLILDEAGGPEPLFVIGSSGIEYALGGARQAASEERRLQDGDAVGTGVARSLAADSHAAVPAAASPVDRLLAVSGSCSPVTDMQIRQALDAGFVGIRVPVEVFLPSDRLVETGKRQLLDEAKRHLLEGRSVVLYTASGPDDPGIERFRQALPERGLQAQDSSRVLGAGLGSLTRTLVREANLRRVLIAGGDTSGYVTRQLGIYALECIARLAPGAPLCRAFAEEEALDGLELVLKGGQVGGEGFFERVRRGE